MIFAVVILMNILFTISIFLYGYVDLKHALLAFQQNHYELTRYTKWLKDKKFNWEDVIIYLVKVLAFIILLFLNKILIAFVVCLILTIVKFSLEKKKSYIKPLVYTARVKRQIVSVILIDFVIVGLVFFLTPIGFSLYPLLLTITPICAWLIIYPMFYLCEPLEKYFRNRFINEAKEIVNANSDLIKVGITGSYGKTSTKNIVQSVISDSFYSLMTPESFNTPLGITRTIREQLKPTHEAFICEMGADKVGDITYLMDFVKPKYGLVTSIGPQHLNTFNTLENIINEKMQMIEKLPSDGVGIVNYDNEYIRNYKVKNNCELITVGVNYQDVDYLATNIKFSKNGSSFDIVYNSEKYHFETSLLGSHNITNILMSVALGHTLGVSFDSLIKSVKNIESIEHRLQLKKINGFTFIDNAFNSNPSGAKVSLDVLAMMDQQRWIVTPGMIDLGAIQDEVNFKFGTQMLDKADKVILVGKNQTKPIYEGLKSVGFRMDNVLVVDMVKEAFAYIYQNADLNDTILLENDLPDAFSC